jgi:phage baseplate assembly protein W
MSRRDAAALALLEQRLGADLALDYAGPTGAWEDADLRTGRTSGLPAATDLATVRGVEAAVQLLVNRLMTHRGELAPLGHPDYGSRHHDLVGEPNVERTRNLVKLFVLEALAQEPRIETVTRCTVSAPHDPPREVVRIEVDLRLVDHDEPLNLVVPFALGVAT